MPGSWRKFLSYLGYETPNKRKVINLRNDYRDFDDDEEELYDRQSVRKLERTGAGNPIIRPVPDQGIGGKVHVVEPKSFNDAQRIADKFKSDTPVIMNLQNVEEKLAKRLIDFTSGLTYGRNGAIQKVADKVFLLSPSNFDVSAEEKRMLWEKGLFYNQS